MAAAAGGYGRQASQVKQQQQQRRAGKDVEGSAEGHDVEQGRVGGDGGGGGSAAGQFCGCVGLFGRSWAEAKEELAEFMLVRGACLSDYSCTSAVCTAQIKAAAAYTAW
jgi:hypothetical protein